MPASIDADDGILTNHDPPSLPILSAMPAVHAGCCLALSEPLLSYLRAVLPKPPEPILSIGSGYGLLEALLNSGPSPLRVIGVEVLPSPNRYLSNDRHEQVNSSRQLHDLAAESSAWLFIYPRRVGLVEEYMRKHGGATVRDIIWVGPAADWDDYNGCFNEEWDVKVMAADTVGGTPWEYFAIASKRLG